MAAAKENLCQGYEKWFRLTTLIDFAGRHLCYDVFFKKEKFPIDGALLYTELEVIKSKIKFPDQLKTVFPSSGITDYNKFDLTLLTSIIQSKFGDKYKTLVGDLKCARNKEFHRGNKILSDTKFDNLWNETIHMLENHGFDIKLVSDLKTSNPFSHHQFKDVAMLNFLGSIDRAKQSKLDQLELVENSL